MEAIVDQPTTPFEIAVEGLQEERLSCVRRLEAALLAESGNGEIETYLQRIESINNALIRLAEAYVIA